MFLRDGAPELVYAQMGGAGQPQFQVQLLHNVYDRGLDVQQALDAPRWVCGRPAIPGAELVASDTVAVESRFDDAVIAGLEARGHHITMIGSYENLVGHMHAIAIDRERGTLAGGADPRADSLALGL
jgi:gamma-glutamyltranspeptidase/glutathione hydrolase